MYFEELSNEILLSIWDFLLDIDVMFSFSNINNRLNSLLYKYCGFYRKLDFRYCSLSMCYYFYKQAIDVFEWRDNLNVLKLGNRYRCCQLDLFTSEIQKSFLLINEDKYFQPLFPHLNSIAINQTSFISTTCRDILLNVVAGGLTMRRFVWNTCNHQAYHSKAFFDWLFQCSRKLHSFQLTTYGISTCFQLNYEDTLIQNYISHDSLVNLHISSIDFLTLNVLTHYLPRLEHLSKFNIILE